MSQEIDLDRLADFTAGVLDAAATREITRLIQTDPAWASAHAELVRADGSIRSVLRAEAARPIEPMPAEVIARLERAFAAGPAKARPPRRDAVVVSLERHRSQIRRRMMAGLTAAAATVIAVVGGISLVPQLTTERSSPGASMADTDSGVAGAPGGEVAAPTQGPDSAAFTLLNSGLDYQPGTLAQLVRAEPGAGRQSQDQVGGPEPAPALPPVFREGVGAELARLTDSTALSSCLEQVRFAHPGRPTVVDFARFQGSPALLILVRTPTSASVVVVGPSCGATGLDERHTAPIG